MEEWLFRIAGAIALIIEMVAILVVAFGSAAALIGIFRVMLAHGSNADKRMVWMHYAQWLVAALTFQLAADRQHYSRADLGPNRAPRGDCRYSHTAYFFSRPRYRGNPCAGCSAPERTT